MRVSLVVLLAAFLAALPACGSTATPAGIPDESTTPGASTKPPAGATSVAADGVSSPSPAATPAAPIEAAPTGSPAMQSGAGAGTTAESGKLSKGIVVGYYVPYDATSWRTLEAEGEHLDYVSPQWVSINACGSIGSKDDQTLNALARSKGIKILPSMLTLDSDLNHELLTDDQVSRRAVEQIVAYVTEEGYDGFDLDLEDVSPGDRQAYTAFVAKLASGLHARGKLLMAAIPAKKSDTTTGWSGAYDYAALGRHLDMAMLMTYDFSWPASPPGSIAPNEPVDQVMRFATSQMPKEKVLLGVAFYGYDWNTTTGARARALRYPDALALAKKYGKTMAQDPATGSATFSYAVNPGDVAPAPETLPSLSHSITTRTPAACGNVLPTSSPAAKPATTPRPTATPARVQQHEVWYENSASLAAKLQVADKNGVGGIGAWRLGQEDPEVWKAVGAWRER